MFDFSEKQVVTEHDLKDVPAGDKVQLAINAILTPLARDLISERKIEVLPRKRSRGRIVAIGADHGGFVMKEARKELLSEIGVYYHDFCTYDTKPVDYPA